MPLLSGINNRCNDMQLFHMYVTLIRIDVKQKSRF